MSYPITPLAGHAYTPPAHGANIKPKSYHSSSFFMPEELRNSLLMKNEMSNNIEHDSSNLPLEVDNYHSLSLLEASSNLPSNLPATTTYKATHSSTGIKYCLRRLHGESHHVVWNWAKLIAPFNLSGFRIQSVKLMMQVVDVWKKFSHPNCVTLREVFTTKAFGDNSLILVYDLHAGSQTLLSKYFTPITNGYGTTGSAFSGDARPFSHKSTLQRTGENPYNPLSF